MRDTGTRHGRGDSLAHLRSLLTTKFGVEGWAWRRARHHPAHHGAIRIESQEGVGTRAQVLLPTRQREQATAPADDRKIRGTVLVVDDDEGVRAVARRALLANGYRGSRVRMGSKACACSNRTRATFTWC